ncbi:MAG TPA: DUF2085 domain-containing protein [Thermomicrobiales bacterium]|nr:DUF2085 domain-containing protein [Thermomicrobiales bacterium]
MSRPVIQTIRTYWLWCAIVAAAVVVFLASPGATGNKAHSVLHGLCAQTPSHTFTFGGQPLPFDGRMTGIYGGSILTFAWLWIRGRVLFYGNPPKRVIAVLTLFVIALAVDGFNSLFHDLGIWYPYEPQNIYRLITGFGTGMSLSIILSWLLASSMWNLSRPTTGIRSLRDVGAIALLAIPYGAAVLSGWSWLYLPLTALLLGSAWLTLSILMLVVVLLLFRIDEKVRAVPQLHLPGAAASILGLVIMLTLAGGRFWLEHTFGITVDIS